MINPLTPELNPSAQRCLPRFFTEDFNVLKGSLCDVFLTQELNPSAQRCLPSLFTGILIFKGLTARRLYNSFGVKGLILARIYT
jgi:hypothetical protein